MTSSEQTASAQIVPETDEIAVSPAQATEAPRIQETNTGDVQTPPDLADKYTFLSLLGRGSQGCVYEAIRHSDGETVAIKVLQINSIKNWKEYDLFWREANTLKLLDMPGVARFYEVIECLDDASPHAYLVQQRIRGKSLAEMIHAGHRFTFQDICSFAIQLLDILKQLHHHNPPIIHRDIKPSNIVLEPDGSQYRVYLTDFGAVCNPLLQRGGSTIAGTYGYMPPEQLMGNVCAASDIYALGITIVELLSGISPADMDIVDFRLVIEKPLENMPYDVVSLLRQMTLPNAEERLCSYGKIKKKFKGFCNNRFDEQNSPNTEISNPVKYNRKLRNIQRIGQKGNMDLWLELPEQTPRELPECFDEIKPYSRNGLFITVLWYARFILNPLNLVKHPLDYLLSLIALYISAFLIIMGTLMVLPLLIVLAILIRDRNKEKKDNIINAEWIHKILRKGKKALATVVGTEFLKERHYGTAYFKVSYTFHAAEHPQEDIVHNVVVPYDPVLKPGDVLPILYVIEDPQEDVEWRTDVSQRHQIYSMPFPLPVQNLAELKECCCCTWIEETANELHGESNAGGVLT